MPDYDDDSVWDTLVDQIYTAGNDRVQREQARTSAGAGKLPSWGKLLSVQAGAEFDSAETAAMEEGLEAELNAWSAEVIGAALTETIQQLRDYVGGSNPPPASDPEGASRPRHPGGWSDVSEQMMNSYYGLLEEDGNGGWSGQIINSDPGAQYLEGKEAYYVVSGVELPDGPFGSALEHAIKTIRPGSRVVSQIGEIEKREESITQGKTS